MYCVCIFSLSASPIILHFACLIRHFMVGFTVENVLENVLVQSSKWIHSICMEETGSIRMNLNFIVKFFP